MLITVPDGDIEDLLANMLAGLHFLPTRLGWQPFVLVYNQVLDWRLEAEPLPELPVANGTKSDDEEAALESFMRGMLEWWALV